jgi:hypothetical protein
MVLEPDESWQFKYNQVRGRKEKERSKMYFCYSQQIINQNPVTNVSLTF